jgi:hypothetical protein
MSMRKPLAATAIVAISIAGGAIGASLLGTANAATPSPSPTTESGTAPGAGNSNEDPAHEAGESAEREAQEHAQENAEENGGTSTPGSPSTDTLAPPSL